MWITLVRTLRFGLSFRASRVTKRDAINLLTTGLENLNQPMSYNVDLQFLELF